MISGFDRDSSPCGFGRLSIMRHGSYNLLLSGAAATTSPVPECPRLVYNYECPRLVYQLNVETTGSKCLPRVTFADHSGADAVHRTALVSQPVRPDHGVVVVPTAHSTALFGQKCQSFLDNLIACFPPTRSWSTD